MGKPMEIELNGERYTATVLLITGRDEKGRPQMCRILQENENVDLSGDQKEFMIVYAKPEIVRGEGVS